MSDNSNKRTAYLVIIFILLLINMVGAYFLFTGNKENVDLTAQVEEVQNEYSELQQDFNSQLVELNQMKGVNAELDSIIAVREAEIQANLDEIAKWKNSSTYNKSELKKAKETILTYEQEKITFQEQVDALISENDELKEIKAILETDLATEKETVEVLEGEKEYLSGKFELGSLLQADEILASGIKVKDNGVEKEVSKLGKVDKFKVCYQTGENKVREPGAVAMQLRIVNPAGETLYVEENGSGTFVNKENGEQIRYTQQAAFEYDNQNKRICIDWSQGIDQVGTYRAFIYQEGHLVGETSIELN